MSKAEALADIEAEKSLLGACLLSNAAVDTALTVLVPADFRIPKHQQIFAHMVEMRENGERIDVVTVSAYFNEEGALGFLHELQNATPSVSAARQYAEIIAGWSLRRRLLYAGATITDMANGRVDSGLDPSAMVEEARSLISDIDMPLGAGDPDPDLVDFISGVNTAHDWLIPGFMEYRDRMLISGLEGSGKTWLLRQLAVRAAAGIHPWTETPVPAVNVLYVDVENSARQIARSMSAMRLAAGPGFDPSRLRVISRPNGLNLTTRADKRWLIERCQANQAQLLVIGPVYRLLAGTAANGDVGGEDQARTATAALDEVRIHCNVGLLMETHAPHGSSSLGRDLRPFGSSVWLRWPEFGWGLRPCDPDDSREFLVEHWRGPRDEREWPRKLIKGGRWPWTAVDGFYSR
jgi:hypothetical protein